MSERRMVLLYGPPAVGKDTITKALADIDDRYQVFPRIKCGPGRTDTYRMVSADQLVVLRSTPGEVLWENQRYGATYVVDRTHLTAMLDDGLFPVLHLGQVGAVHAITTTLTGARAITVALTCPRPIAAQRIEARGTGDGPERLAAYDVTEPLTDAALTIDTSLFTPDQAAQLIAHHG